MEISKKQYEYLLFALSVVLAVFRFSYLGLRYTPYLDDYVQYSYYPQLQDSWQRVYADGAGVLYTRPLAGLLDLTIWSRMWGNLGLATGVISILHGLSAVLFYKAFNLCGIKMGTLFLVIYILIPINTEATYWLSASSRIVVSMFLISLSVYFGARKNRILFVLFNFLSVWFYEQTAILSTVMAIWICLRKKEKYLMVFPLISAALLAVFYLKFGFLGDNAQRLQAVGLNGAWHNALSTVKDFLYILFTVQLKLVTKGFVRGFMQIALDFSLMWLGFLTILAILFFVLSHKCEGGKDKQHYGVILGVIFMLTPILPFFVLGEGGFNMRNAAPCVLGVAIILDRFLSAAPQRYVCLLGAVLVFWFSVVSVSELNDYSYVAKRDFELASKIAESVTDATKTVNVKVSTPKYYPQNAPYRDHIMSMTGSDWGMTGIVRAISKNEKVTVNTAR